MVDDRARLGQSTPVVGRSPVRLSQRLEYGTNLVEGADQGLQGVRYASALMLRAPEGVVGEVAYTGRERQLTPVSFSWSSTP